jgi:DNA-directed RNA polymerase subunit H (RpoH/RPB5)
MKKDTAILSVLFLSYIAVAAALPRNPIQEDILERAYQAQSGLIVAVTEPGEVAAETAWLLSEQIKRDNTFDPLFLALQPEEQNSVLATLNLSESSLPALIYYDRDGQEISRVTNVLPSPMIKRIEKP